MADQIELFSPEIDLGDPIGAMAPTADGVIATPAAAPVAPTTLKKPRRSTALSSLMRTSPSFHFRDELTAVSTKSTPRPDVRL